MTNWDATGGTLVSFTYRNINVWTWLILLSCFLDWLLILKHLDVCLSVCSEFEFIIYHLKQCKAVSLLPLTHHDWFVWSDGRFCDFKLTDLKLNTWKQEEACWFPFCSVSRLAASLSFPFCIQHETKIHFRDTLKMLFDQDVIKVRV